MTGGVRGTGFLILRTYPVISGLRRDQDRPSPLDVHRAFPKSILGTLSKARGLCAEGRILRFAQNDRSHNSNFGRSLGCTGWGLTVALACWRRDRRKKRFSMPFRAVPTKRRDQGCVRGWSYSRGLGVGWRCGSSCSWRSWDIREPQWLYGFRPVAKRWGFA